MKNTFYSATHPTNQLEINTQLYLVTTLSNYLESQCYIYHLREFIAKGPKYNLSAMSRKISENIRKYQETLKNSKKNIFFIF